jgi:predicted HTH transcriptional regulator
MCGLDPRIARQTRSSGASPLAIAMTRNLCRNSTLKRSTLELLRSYSRRSANSRADLGTLRILTKHQGRKVPTVGGMLLFGQEREHRFPDAWIQAGRFDGLDKVRLVDALTIRSFLPRAVDEAIEFVQKHDLHGLTIGDVRHADTWTLPPAAVREAIINAVVHADYSQRGGPIRIAFFNDRLEIENPGLLPFGLTVQDMREGISRLRNRVVGRPFSRNSSQELGTKTAAIGRNGSCNCCGAFIRCGSDYC